MIFRQFFDSASATYTYLLAERHEAVIIDPVLEKVGLYLQILDELNLKLVKALDTHVHADHVTGLGALRDSTRCVTVMGRESTADVVAMRVGDGDKVEVDGIRLTALYTPGHTSDSYSFVLPDRVFTGDTLLIRGTGRTDFQNGDARAQYHSLFDKLLKLPSESMVYPAHDYRGMTVSTIAEERAHNPRLQVGSVDEYVELMAGLRLPHPKLMDVAVPANRSIGLVQDRGVAEGWALLFSAALAALDDPDTLVVDLREDAELGRDAQIPRSLHLPYGELARALQPGGELATAAARGRRILFYCAFGERSAMAVDEARDRGITGARSIAGGMEAWRQAGGPLAAADDEIADRAPR